MGREVEERDIYAASTVSADLCVRQTGVKVSDVCGVSQKALGNAVSTRAVNVNQHFWVLSR